MIEPNVWRFWRQFNVRFVLLVIVVSSGLICFGLAHVHLHYFEDLLVEELWEVGKAVLAIVICLISMVGLYSLMGSASQWGQMYGASVIKQSIVPAPRHILIYFDGIDEIFDEIGSVSSTVYSSLEACSLDIFLRQKTRQPEVARGRVHRPRDRRSRRSRRRSRRPHRGEGGEGDEVGLPGKRSGADQGRRRRRRIRAGGTAGLMRGRGGAHWGRRRDEKDGMGEIVVHGTMARLMDTSLIHGGSLSPRSLLFITSHTTRTSYIL